MALDVVEEEVHGLQSLIHKAVASFLLINNMETQIIFIQNSFQNTTTKGN